MTERALFAEIKRRLAREGLCQAIEAKVLFETAVGHRYAEAPPEQEVTVNIRAKTSAILKRRLAGEPLQYIAQSWPFLDFDLEIGPGVLIPRPETEQVALAAIDCAKRKNMTAVLDLCSGSGCIAIALQRALPEACVTAVEREPSAFYYMQRNTHALSARVRTVRADIFGYERELPDDSVDLIVANPPYVTPQEYQESLPELAYEPKSAFLAGEDGLLFYRHIITRYRSSLRSSGIMLFETGYSQTLSVTRLFEQGGYSSIEARTDAYGVPRIVLAHRGNGR